MFCNITSYKFTVLNEAELTYLCKALKTVATKQNLKGTILLSTEGINLFLAGEKDYVTGFQEHLDTYPFFYNLHYKYSYSDSIPFKKLSVKIRNEIITFKQDHIDPVKFTAPYISPQELEKKFAQNEKFTLLDTRNSFEYELGTFKTALHLNIDTFREFPDALKAQDIDKKLPLITFCTAGIRCEKAAAYLLEQGFEDVYQLQGGILHYLEQCDDQYFKGDCFVFDDRIAVNTKLQPVNINLEENDTES